MDTKDYRIIVTLATSLAQPCICNGRTVYELDVHKHRNNDCYYHIGFAYEIACILNRKVTLPKLDFKVNKDNIDEDLLTITHCLADEDAQYLLEKVPTIVDHKNIMETHAGCVISTHCGPRCIGILYILKENK